MKPWVLSRPVHCMTRSIGTCSELSNGLQESTEAAALAATKTGLISSQPTARQVPSTFCEARAVKEWPGSLGWLGRAAAGEPHLHMLAATSGPAA